MPGQFIFVDFNALQQSKSTSILLPSKAAKLLSKAKTNFIASAVNILTSRKSGFSAVLQRENSIVDITFSHSLIKTGENQWHVIIGSKKGSGSFGAVNQSTLKIVTEKKDKKYVAKLVKVNDVVKIQKDSKDLSHSTLLDIAKKEAIFQRKHGVKVLDPIDAIDQVITVIEDCGTSLDKLFPLQPSENYSFKHRLSIAAMIASDMLLLEQRGVVHRDLKPANICYKQLSDKIFQIIFIDFGLAQDVDSKKNRAVEGTYAYMAPEIFKMKGSSYASDMYALAAILGELLGAENILKYKLEAFQKSGLVADLIAAPYCFEGVFEGFSVAGVDRGLLEDFTTLLKRMSDPNPANRPSIDHLNKFLITIPSRVDEYANFNAEWEKMVVLFENYEGFLHEFNLLKNKHELRKLESNYFAASKVSLTAFNSAILRSQAALEKEFIKLSSPQSHLDLAYHLVKKNRRADFANEDYPFPKLKNIIEILDQENAKFEKALQGLNTYRQTFNNSGKFLKSNSSGTHKISAILNSKHSPLDKLQKIRQIGIDKTTKGFWHSYSHSSIFGKGRHKNVDELYQRLAKLEPKPYDKKGEYLLESQLEEISKFISTTPFTH